MKFLYRAQDINDNWCYGSLIMYDDSAEIVGFDVYNCGNDAWQKRDIETSKLNTVGQYIGKDDIHGNKIFEGDIIVNADNQFNYNLGTMYRVVYSHTQCQFYGYNKLTDAIQLLNDDVVVIGNVFNTIYKI